MWLEKVFYTIDRTNMSYFVDNVELIVQPNFEILIRLNH